MATPKIPKPKTQCCSGTIQFLIQEELKRLFAAIDSPRDKALFLLAHCHGLRASEIGDLQCIDADLKRKGQALFLAMCSGFLLFLPTSLPWVQMNDPLHWYTPRMADARRHPCCC